MKSWVATFLYLSAAQRFPSSLPSMLAFSFNYLGVVILGKAALSIMMCLPSKRSPLPLSLCELISTSHSILSLPRFAIPHFHSFVLFLSFQSFCQLSPQPSYPFGITSYFLFHFLLQKMFLDLFHKNLWCESLPMWFCFRWAPFPWCSVGSMPLAFTLC